MAEAQTALDTLCINTIRTLAIDAVQGANSGHPGLPLGAAPMAYVLWQKHLRHNPADPSWADRDRFVLSAGHGSMLLYALLHLTGYDLTLDDIKAFRQWDSHTPGHPEAFMTPGVEATTGPLGQGTANAVGMAIAERYLAGLFNRPNHPVVDHFTYALVSDGDLMEGISAEAASLAGHLNLGKLIYMYDANDVSLDGPTSMAFTEDVGKRYEAYGWQVLHVAHGDSDLTAIDQAITAAKADTGHPSIIIVRTTIGYGSPNKAGKSAAHGSPLGAPEVRLTKQALGWDPDAQFLIPQEAGAHFAEALPRGHGAQDAWQRAFSTYAQDFPDLAATWQAALAGALPADLTSTLPAFKAGESMATREAGGKVLNALADRLPWLIGGDADLGGSTLTPIKSSGSFNGQTGLGRNLHFGVREHAMGAIANGMAYHGGIHPFVSTFFTFSDYMKPAVRLAALSHLPVTFVWTHDSIGLGEDGPTHQPIEHLAALRAVPNMITMRPADAHETKHAWLFALARRKGPVGLVLSRQKLTILAETESAAAAGVPHGAYILSESAAEKPQAILLATGSEVHIALGAQTLLHQAGIHARVVSMPCFELFAAQDKTYRDKVLPPQIAARVAIEAAVPFGWEKWVGERGVILGINHYGASAPAETIFEKFGLTASHAAEAVQALLKG